MDENEEFFKKRPDGRIILRSGSYAKLKKQILKENPLAGLSDEEISAIMIYLTEAQKYSGRAMVLNKMISLKTIRGVFEKELSRRREKG